MRTAEANWGVEMTRSGVGTAGRLLVTAVTFTVAGGLLFTAVGRGWDDTPALRAGTPAVAGEGIPTTGRAAPAGAGQLTATATPVAALSPTGTTTGAGQPGRTTRRSVAGLTAADRAAGLTSLRVRNRGTGVLRTVPGTGRVPAGTGPVHRVRVRVEGGLGVDAERFADFALTVLNDPRGWGGGRPMRFVRTDTAAAVDLVLASPNLSQQLCHPLRTMGTLSCRNGRNVVITLYRWVKAVPEYGADRTGYRRYVINHEMGHWLGHGHQLCPGRGEPAPVMMQQTLGLRGCRPNPWPYPDRRN